MVGDKIVDKKKTVLVPYDNIKNSLDEAYGIKGGLPTSEDQVRYELSGSIYDMAKSRVNDLLKDNVTDKSSK